MTPNNFVITIEIDGLSDGAGQQNNLTAQFQTFLESLVSQRLICGFTYAQGPSGNNPIVANS